MQIIVNGKEIIVAGSKTVEYDDLVYHAFGDKAQENFPYTVVWGKRKGNCGGTLSRGESIEIESDMVFAVADTSNA